MGISIQLLECGHWAYQKGFQPGADSAGGVSVLFTFTNTGDKTIKYASFGFIPYNAVGDAVGCTISNQSEKFVKCTGPIDPKGVKAGVTFENAWYNPSITSVKLSKVLVQYMDGTEETIDGSQVSVTNPKEGCYVATAVYGSYDCPEVWTLRRFRDNTLAKTWHGRAFIRTYYAISPTLVKWFGHSVWFNKMWKGKLDRMVADLKADGVEDTPYEDQVW